MNDILDIEIILKKQKYSKIYNIGIVLLIILLIFIYVSFVYTYKTYYINKATMIDGDLKLLVNLDDIKYITTNNNLKIDNLYYEYKLSKISEELYIDESLNNYKYIYLKVNNLNNIDNYVYEIKLVKENKKLIKYLKEYI